MLIRVADEMGFKVATFQHVLEGYKVAKEIAAHGAGASTFSDWWGYKIEAADAIPYNAAIMTRKGVVVSINSDDAEQARRLNNEAAKTVRYGGLTDDEALATVTINPAKQLRIDNRVGSLESRQGRRRRHLESSSAQHGSDCRTRLYRRCGLLRPNQGLEARVAAMAQEKGVRTQPSAEQTASRRCRPRRLRRRRRRPSR